MSEKSFKDGTYWKARSELIYYRYLELFIRCIGVNAKSILDVGSGNSPYLEWFDWIQRKVSVDIGVPYASENVQGIQGDILNTEFPRKFNIVTCLQVLEHIPKPHEFSKRLLELGDIVLISVPYNWPEGKTKGHVQDPVDLKKVIGWFNRKPNYHLIVEEPFRRATGKRMFCLFDTEAPSKNYRNNKIWRDRRKGHS